MIVYSQCGRIVTDTSLMNLIVDENMIVAEHPLKTAKLIMGRYNTEDEAIQALAYALANSRHIGARIELK